MEALVAVAAAALTIYDMLKAIDKAMVIGDICLVEKRGGRTGTYTRSDRAHWLASVRIPECPERTSTERSEPSERFEPSSSPVTFRHAISSAREHQRAANDPLERRSRTNLCA